MVNVNPARVISQPASILLNALNAEARWEVEGGMTYVLSLVNQPGATAQFVGTVAFEVSTDGANWTAVKALPLSTPTAQAVSSTSLAGIWLIDVPNGGSVFIRARMSAFTSGSVNALIATYGLPAASVSLPWSYTVTANGVLVGPLDASGISEIDIQISAITTTVLVAEGTNDPTLATWDTIPVQDVKVPGVIGLSIAAASTYRFSPAGYHWVRIRVLTTGTVLTVQGVVARLGQAALPDYRFGATWDYNGTVTVTTDTAIKAAAGAGLRNCITSLQLQNTGAAATTFVVKDGATVKWQCQLPAAMALPVDMEFITPIKSSANTALNIACGTASSVFVNAQGYVSP